MNYPVWDVPLIGSGLVVAIIAIIHVLISHLAIGAGAFLFVAELWSDRQPDGERIRAWLHRYAVFFLVFTTVFGAVTGVGIWFSIQLANPEATSLVIHQFVFAWATEYVAFLGELSVLYLYYYGWYTGSRRQQTFLAGAYFVIAWFSLFVINGVLTFMLTPGAWRLESPSLFQGFFNPGFWPSLLVRTVVMLLLGGLAGILVAACIEDDIDLKSRIVRFSGMWVVPAAALMPLLAIWYWTTLPESTIKLAVGGIAGLGGGKLEVITRNAWLAGTAGGLVVLGTLALVLRPRAATTAAAIALLLAVQLGIMGGEFFRELGRKPWVVYGVLYSNALWAKDAARPALRSTPFLARAGWHPEGLEPLSARQGEWIFRLQCGTCHTRDGYRGLVERTAAWTPAFGYRWLDTMGGQGVMPPFQGTDDDRAALTAYLISLQGKQVSGRDVLQEEAAAAQAAGTAGSGTSLEQSTVPGAAGPAVGEEVPR